MSNFKIFYTKKIKIRIALYTNIGDSRVMILCEGNSLVDTLRRKESTPHVIKHSFLFSSNGSIHHMLVLPVLWVNSLLLKLCSQQVCEWSQLVQLVLLAFYLWTIHVVHGHLVDQTEYDNANQNNHGVGFRGRNIQHV